MPEKFLVDFSELQDLSTTVVPPGVYILKVCITGKEPIEKGRDKGTPYINARFEIVAPEEYAGISIWQRLMLTGKATFLFAELFRALGYEVEAGKSFEASSRDIRGQYVAAQIAQEDYQGDTRNVIKHFMAYEVEEAS